MFDFVNPCGGKRWRILPSGLIEVEGEGIPTVSVGSREYAYMESTWKNWAALFRSAARREGVPVAWLLAIATMETGYLASSPDKQAQAVSPVGARGIMQIMPATGRSLGVDDPDDLFKPEVNIGAAARLIRKINTAERGGLPGLSAVYNSGRLCTTDPARNEWMLLADANYPRHVIKWNNTALETGLVLPLGKGTFVIAGAALGTAVGMLLLRSRGN